tara:strand:+ start:514 stop:891 length:378 start_codon:yes stop_codon:yes gene_type:complete
MLDEKCEKRLSDIMDESGDAGFEFIAPLSVGDAKNKIAKMIMFDLETIEKSFDLSRWNEVEIKRLVKATSYFFTMLDKWTITKEESWDAPKTLSLDKEEIFMEYTMDYEVKEGVKTFADYLEMKT